MKSSEKLVIFDPLVLETSPGLNPNQGSPSASARSPSLPTVNGSAGLLLKRKAS